MVLLRQLTPTDAAMLSTVGGTTLIESHGHSAPAEVMQVYVEKAFSTDACCKELMDDRNIFYAVYDNGHPAGYSKISLHAPHPAISLEPVTKLERLYLLRPFYAKNLGDLLLQKALELSKQAGEKGMWLNVWKENKRAIRFYEKQGFEIIGESEFVLTETHANPNWVMLLEYKSGNGQLTAPSI